MRGKLPEEPSNPDKTATVLGFHKQRKLFCLITGNNITWYDTDWSKLRKNNILFTIHELIESELFLNRNFVIKNNVPRYGANFDSIIVCQSQKHCLLDWKQQNIYNVKTLQKDNYALSILMSHLFKDRLQLQIENATIKKDNKVYKNK